MSEVKRPANDGLKGAHRRKLFLFRIVTVSLGSLLSLILAEAARRIFEKARLGDRAIEQKLIYDPQLGSRLAHYTLGHDANGFGNDDVPQHADIVSTRGFTNVGRKCPAAGRLAPTTRQDVQRQF